MTREEIIRMAREAGISTQDAEQKMWWLERFAKLVQDDYSNKHAQLWLDRCHAFMLAEREACEALYEHEDVQAPVGNSAWGEAYQDGWIAGAQAYREAIRARGQQ